MDISAKHAKGELPNVRLGSWLCENAKTLNRDRRTCSSKTVLVAQRASGFNLEIDLKNIILRRVSIFEFLHSQGRSRTDRASRSATQDAADAHFSSDPGRQAPACRSISACGASGHEM
jgi:hypothetical protein